MLKNSNVEVVYSIERYTPDAKHKSITIEIATGNILNDIFVSDERVLIKHRIVNTPDKSIQKTETLIVDINRQVTLSLMPLANNNLEVNEVNQPHTTGQVVDCVGYSENDNVSVSYYYTEIGRDWFTEATVFVSDDHPEYAGLTDYEYNSKRLWSILLEMGLITGEVI